MNPLAAATATAHAVQRALRANDTSLQTTLRQLSSGLRVTSARDDAAGLAIAERMTSRVRGDAQALRNTHDAISLLQVADGALGVMTSSLQRMRELLAQAGDGANGDAERQSLDRELRQQRDEFDRIATATTFNGHALLDGSFGTAMFQIGAGSADMLAVALGGSMRSADVGAVAVARSSDLRTVGNRNGGFVFDATYTTVPITQLDFSRPEVAFRGGTSHTVGSVATDYSGGGGAAQFTVDGVAIALNADFGSLAGVATAVQAQLGGRYDVTAVAGGVSITSRTAVDAPQIVAVGGANSAAFGNATGTAGVPASHSTAAGFTVDDHRVALTANCADFDALANGIQAQLDATARGQYRVGGSAAGLSIKRLGALDPPVVCGFTGIGAEVFAAAPQSGLELAAGDFVVRVGRNTAVSVIGVFRTPGDLADAIDRQVADVAADIDDDTGRLQIAAKNTLALSGTAVQSSGTLAFEQLVVDPSGSLNDADATTAATRPRSLMRVDAALDAIASRRASFGALASRLDAIASSLQTDRTLTAAARGRIVDADYAAQTALLAREQVLQQAANAMLAQANANAFDVLQLLR